MLDQIPHTKLLEWAAFMKIEEEEAEQAREQATTNGGTRVTI